MSAPTRPVRLAVGSTTWGALPLWRTCSRCHAGIWVAADLGDAQYFSCRECAMRTNARPVVSAPVERARPKRAPLVSSLAWLGVGAGFALATLALSAALLAGTEAGDPWANLTLWALVVLAGTASLGATFHGLGEPRNVAPEPPRGAARASEGRWGRYRATRRLRAAERASHRWQRGRLTATLAADRHRLWDGQLRDALTHDGRLRERFEAWDDEETERLDAELMGDLATLYPKATERQLRNLIKSFGVLARDLPTRRETGP